MCHEELTMVINEPKMVNQIFVCNNSACPNWGLLCISEEMMMKAEKK